MPVELVDKFKKGSRAELPGSHSHTHTTLAPELGRAACLQRKTGRAICWVVAVADVVFSEALPGASTDSGRSSSADRPGHGAASIWRSM
jgi:hypothetical protein